MNSPPTFSSADLAPGAEDLHHADFCNRAPSGAQGASITGTIYYNGNPMSYTMTGGRAVIELYDANSGWMVLTNLQYDAMTGVFAIDNVQSGRYTPYVRIEAGYPFNIESGGDYHSRIKGLNADIVVAPNDNLLQRNLEVVHGIHLKRPVDNQVLRTNISDPPESFYQERRAPSADIFEWDKVPGAAYYQAFILKVRGTEQRTEQQPLNVIERYHHQRTLVEPVWSLALGLSPPDTQYMFKVEAYNAATKLIGTFTNYYRGYGMGGWLAFRVIPTPR